MLPLSWFLLLEPVTAQVLPPPGEPPAVDTITPVPAPEIPIGEAPAIEMPENLKIENSGGKIEGDVETGVHLGGPVKITGDNGLELFSDMAVLDLQAKSVTLTGNVSIYQGNLLQRGEKAVYFYETKHLDASGMRASMGPILLEAGKFTVEQKNGKLVFVGHNAGITTHDVQNPNYWVRSDKTTIFPGEKVVFNDLRLYAGDRQVFWLPYLSQALDGELGYHFTPGAKSNWGAFLLNTYGLMLDDDEDDENAADPWLLSRWHFDIRSTRGLGVGLDLVDTRIDNNEEIPGFSLYYLYDLDPNKSRDGVKREDVDPNRFKLELKHRMEPKLSDHADWRVDSNMTWLSDDYYLEDFEMQRYRTDPNPDNTLGIFRRDDHSLLSLFTRVRPNDFYRSDTRLPELAYDQVRSPFFGLPVLHEGRTSLGFIGEKAGDYADSSLSSLNNLTLTDPGVQSFLGKLDDYERSLAESMLALPLDDPRRDSILDQLEDSNYARFSTHHEWSLPMMLGGGISLAPQAGFGYSRYAAADGPDSNFGRASFHLGTEASVKFSKNYGGLLDHSLGIDGLLHVFQPYTRWSMLSADDYSPGDPAVDRLTPTTRPRPLDPMRFTAIDQMDSWNVVRLGARNRLITRRDNRSHEWLYLDTYLDTFIEDPEADRTFSNLYNDARWHPLPWLGVDMGTQFPISGDEDGFTELSTRVRFMPTDNFEFAVGYRFLNNHPTLLDSNHLNIDTYSRLTENWGVGTRHIFEFDDGTMELQQYMINRDLGNWVVGIGVSSRDNRYENEYGAVLTLTLKDFPSSSLPFQLSSQ